jgi:PPP family 3-phenylpropionic acid transporter
LTLFTRLSSNYFFYFAILGLVSPYLSIFLDSKGFNSVELGEIFAILTAMKIIAPSMWAILADKTGQQLLIIRLGALFALISFFMLFWLDSYWPISFSLAMFSLFWTAILPQLEVFTLKSVRRSSKIYARIRLWGSIGFIVLAMIAGQIMEMFSIEAFPTSFATMGSLILLLLFISTLTLTPQYKPNVESKVVEPIRSKLLEARFVIFFISGVLLQISFGPYYGFFALFLRDLAYDGFTIGLLISLGVVAEVLVFVYAGFFFKVFTLKQLLIFSLGITALRWYLVAIFADSIFILSLTQIIHAASFALYHSASMLFISDHFSVSQQSRGQAIYLGGVYGIGGAIGAYLSGLLWMEGEGAKVTFIVASCMSLIAAVLMIFFKSKTHNEKSPV